MGSTFLLKILNRVIEKVHFTSPLLLDNGVGVRNTFHLYLQVRFLGIEVGQGNVVLLQKVLAVVDACLVWVVGVTDGDLGVSEIWSRRT